MKLKLLILIVISIASISLFFPKPVSAQFCAPGENDCGQAPGTPSSCTTVHTCCPSGTPCGSGQQVDPVCHSSGSCSSGGEVDCHTLGGDNYCNSLAVAAGPHAFGYCDASGNCQTGQYACQAGPSFPSCGGFGGTSCPTGQGVNVTEYHWANDGNLCSANPSGTSAVVSGCQPMSQCQAAPTQPPGGNSYAHNGCKPDNTCGVIITSTPNIPNDCSGCTAQNGCAKPTNPNPPAGCTGGLCCAVQGDSICDSYNGENSSNAPECSNPNGGGGPGGNGSCTLGSGAGGCSDGSGRCCQSGLACKNGTCTSGGVVDGACNNYNPITLKSAMGDVHAISPGVHEDGTRSSMVSVDGGGADVHINYSQDPDNYNFPNGNGACNAKGRFVQVVVGTCDPGTTVYNTTTCHAQTYSWTSPNTQNWDGNGWINSNGDGTTHINIPRNVPGNFGQGTCGSNCVPSPAHWVDGQIYWYQLNINCVCNGIGSGVWSDHMIFLYGPGNIAQAWNGPSCTGATMTGCSQPAQARCTDWGPNSDPRWLQCQQICSSSNPDNYCSAGGIPALPNPPDLECHDASFSGLTPPLSSGRTDDICNNDILSTSSPQIMLSARNTGPSNAEGQEFRYTFTDLDSGASVPFTVNTISGLNEVVTKDIRTFPGVPIINKHHYAWSVVSIDPNTGNTSTPSPTWNVSYDATPPNIGPITITPALACYAVSDIAGGGVKASVTVTPASAPIANVTFEISNSNGSGTPVTVSATPSGPNTYSHTLVASDFNSGPNNQYIFRASATDTSGNSAGPTSPRSFVFQDSCSPAYVKTSGGDIHANTSAQQPTPSP